MKKLFIYLAIITIILLNCIITKENKDSKSEKSDSQKKNAKRLDGKANAEFETQTDSIDDSKYLKDNKNSSKLNKKKGNTNHVSNNPSNEEEDSLRVDAIQAEDMQTNSNISYLRIP